MGSAFSSQVLPFSSSGPAQPLSSPLDRPSRKRRRAESFDEDTFSSRRNTLVTSRKMRSPCVSHTLSRGSLSNYESSFTATESSAPSEQPPRNTANASFLAPANTGIASPTDLSHSASSDSTLVPSSSPVTEPAAQALCAQKCLSTLPPGSKSREPLEDLPPSSFSTLPQSPTLIPGSIVNATKDCTTTRPLQSVYLGRLESWEPQAAPTDACSNIPVVPTIPSKPLSLKDIRARDILNAVSSVSCVLSSAYMRSFDSRLCSGLR